MQKKFELLLKQIPCVIIMRQLVVLLYITSYTAFNYTTFPGLACLQTHFPYLSL